MTSANHDSSWAITPSNYAVSRVAHTLRIFAVALGGLTGTAQAADPSWMTVDPVKKIMTADLVAGWSPKNGVHNFNGYYQGDMTPAVSVGWNVKVNFMNHDEMLPHSILLTK